MKGHSTINGNLDITHTHLQVANADKFDYDGSLTINGDFVAKNSNIMKAGNAPFIITQNSTISDSTLIMFSTNGLREILGEMLMLTSNGGINLLGTNKVEYRIYRTINDLESYWGVTILDTNSTESGRNLEQLVTTLNTGLRSDGKNLYAFTSSTSLKTYELAQVEMDLVSVKEAIAEETKGENNNKTGYSTAEKEKLSALQGIIEAKKAEIESKSDESIAKDYDVTLGNQSGSIAQSAIAAGGKAGAIMANDLLFNNGKGAIKETFDSALQIANDSAQNPSTLALNMQSDMATATRMARFSNPYTKPNYYAQNTKTTQRVLKKASGEGEIYSDVPLFTSQTHENLNNIWANLFGGANLIGENIGAMGGLNFGYDRKIGAHFLGAYMSYAYATIKQSFIEQKAHNIQAGLYSRLVFDKNEVDLKLSAQAGVTNQTRTVASYANDADFTRAFMAFSANYGYVFKMPKGVYLKPLVGLNLYFSHTPKYSEKGDLAQTINANNSTNLTLDLGLDLRAYWSENSFFFVTPKFEQYIVAKNGDFVGAFVGSSNNFKIAGQNKLKTYFQGIIGADFGVNESATITLSFGAKQIIANLNNSDKNETFLSGNVGFKYRF